jgi:hypothetical protein
VQGIINREIIKQYAIFSGLMWLALSILTPAHIANFDFRHFIPDEGMTISFSKSSPPLAVLEDERLGFVAAEPLQALKSDKHTKVISAGTQMVWPRVARLAQGFRWQKHFHQASNTHRRFAVNLSHKPFRGGVNRVFAVNLVTHRKFKKLSRVARLARLTQAIPVTSGIHKLCAKH